MKKLEDMTVYELELRLRLEERSLDRLKNNGCPLAKVKQDQITSSEVEILRLSNQLNKLGWKEESEGLFG